MKSSVKAWVTGGRAALALFMAASVNWLKNKRHGAQTALVIGFLLPAGSAAAQNLVTNPGFETGTTTGWFAFGPPTISVETSQVHSGIYACLVTNRTATWNGIAQSLVGVLQAGQTYNVSAWVRLVSGGNQTMQLTMQETDGSGTSYAAIASGSVSSSGWTQLSGQYTYNPSGTVSALNFYAEVPSSTNAAYYIDDVQLSAATTITNPPIYGVSAVDWNNVHQRIDGFGASSAWNGSWTAAQADLLFSTNNSVTYSGGTYAGVGLSLLRNHIAYASDPSANSTPTTVETSIMQMAQARGARVWSAPWTPAAGFKSVNDIYDTNTATAGGINGGSYLGSGNNATNQAYASQLANYVASMKNNYGVNLYALSLQNEPDANVTSYEACQWTGAQFHDFVTNLYAALAAQGVGSTKIMLPESQNWTDPHNLAGSALSDPNVLAEVGIIANHDYVPDNSVGDQSVPAAIATGGKAMWETEVALLSGSDSSIANGVYWARRIYQYMTQAQANAYHYWWLVASDNGGLIVNSVPAKRLFAFGQYSRFVRPNFYRINATSSQPSALISAYKDTNSTAFAIVVANTNAATNVIQTFNLTNFTAASVTPWITSATLSLAPQTPVNVTNSSFAFELPALSVVTFVGQADLAPTNISLSNASIPENQPAGTTVGGLSTTGPYAGSTFTYTLVSGAGSTGNGSFTISGSNLLSAASFNFEAQNSYSIRVRSTDQSGLYVEKAFTITVTDVNEPPSLAPISNLTAGAGVVITITNVATDPDLPAQTLTFSLLSGPVGSTLNPTNGVFSWRPLVSQAGTTNVVTVAVADNGTPSLSATNSFTITVNPLGQAALSSIAVAGDQLTIIASGPLGPDYTLLTSTNLLDWQPLLTTNPAAMPFSLTDTNLGDAARFYRLQLGP